MTDAQVTANRTMRGLETMAELDGKDRADAVPETAEAIKGFLGPIGEYVTDFVMGDIYSRPGLGLRDRELVTITVLTVLARGTQLRTRMGTALNVGLTAEEIEEAIIQTVPFAGFPTALEALGALREVVGARAAD